MAEDEEAKIKEKIMLSNKNFDFKKLSKSIVVYHQMKSHLTQSNGQPFSGSRYKNAMMLSAEDKNMDDHYYNDEIFANQFQGKAADGLDLAI